MTTVLDIIGAVLLVTAAGVTLGLGAALLVAGVAVLAASRGIVAARRPKGDI